MEQELSKIDYIRELIADCRYDDALELLNLYSDEEPDNKDYNYELARIFMEMGNYPSAISNLELVADGSRNHLSHYAQPFTLQCIVHPQQCSTLFDTFMRWRTLWWRTISERRIDLITATNYSTKIGPGC